MNQERDYPSTGLKKLSNTSIMDVESTLYRCVIDHPNQGDENNLSDIIPFTCNKWDYYYHSPITFECIFCPNPDRWDDINGNCGDRFVHYDLL